MVGGGAPLTRVSAVSATVLHRRHAQRLFSCSVTTVVVGGEGTRQEKREVVVQGDKLRAVEEHLVSHYKLRHAWVAKGKSKGNKGGGANGKGGGKR